jgi:hypothetical protein
VKVHPSRAGGVSFFEGHRDEGTMHTTATKNQRPKQTRRTPEDWLEAMCHHRSWNEREVLSVLADVSPSPTVSKDARAKTEAQRHRAAPARREGP